MVRIPSRRKEVGYETERQPKPFVAESCIPLYHDKLRVLLNVTGSQWKGLCKKGVTDLDLYFKRINYHI